MANTFLPMTPENFEVTAKKWLQIMRFNESGTVINPVRDHFYMIPYLLQNKKLLRKVLGPYYNKYILVYVELSINSTPAVLQEALVKICEKRSVQIDSQGNLQTMIDALVEKGYEVVFLLARVEEHFIQQTALMTELEILSRGHRMSVINFAEQNLTNQQFLAQQRRYSTMFQNIVFLPYYNEEAVMSFITRNEKLWDFHLPEGLKERIYTMCGGNLWLISQALRYYRNTGDTEQMFSHDEIVRKTIASYNQLFPNEQEVLYHAIFDKKKVAVTEPAFSYLIKAGILQQTDSGIKLTIALFEQVMHRQQAVEALSVRKNLVYKADTVIDSAFTEKEKKLLTYLLQKKQVPVTRERLSKVLSENGHPYSDWALDQLVSRLRGKLVKVGFPEDIIKTKKGVGYILSA